MGNQDDLKGLFEPTEHIDFDSLKESEINFPLIGKHKVLETKGFCMLIPLEVMRWPTGEPMKYIEHKYPWLRSLTPDQLIAFGKMSGPQQEDEYFKWIADNPQPEQKWEYPTDKQSIQIY